MSCSVYYAESEKNRQQTQSRSFVLKEQQQMRGGTVKGLKSARALISGWVGSNPSSETEISETTKPFYASEPLSYKTGDYYLPNRLWIRNNAEQ